MRVLMATPAVDSQDSALGFIPSWISSLAGHLDTINVVTPRYNPSSRLPRNVHVYALSDWPGTLPKLVGYNRTMLRFLAKDTDLVFCHMAPRWVLPVAAYAWLFHTPSVWFRAHSSVTWQVRVVHRLVNRVATSSEPGFRIRSQKIVIVGQGTDVTRFHPPDTDPQGPPMVLNVGRVSPAKGQETLLRAATYLAKELGRSDVQFHIVGEPLGATEQAYHRHLRELVAKNRLQGQMHFVGKVPFESIVPCYHRCRVFVNLSSTGSLDKTVLEAMACGRPVVTCNEAYYPLFDDEMKQKCYFEPGNYQGLASRIEWFLSHDEPELRHRLRAIVVQKHSLDALTRNLIGLFQQVIEERQRRAS